MLLENSEELIKKRLGRIANNRAHCIHITLLSASALYTQHEFIKRRGKQNDTSSPSTPPPPPQTLDA